ncbi:outer membrane beta-barrel protein [Niabella drilacis]|uniref:Outer membrane protein beta-barrel domain-containing protein n=1 Tax=Niabella drilacis (strain DSM 25811 / CCM 8410 / CCUG 62505 / LMG 26954 / E90) TaxID=1285928 RepID=A0A1G6U5Z3_NIADE|nr:outer membrane beta-barrel protein [Niabella drilacis]SDD36842.1 Outer membrane protein beta-barrel domain-containing protein [Niabella drilacis]
MKQLSFIAFLLIAGSLPATAQTGWNIGDRAALGHSWTVGNKPNNTKRRFHPVFELGRIATYNFTDVAGIGFGTFFSSQGASFKDENSENRLIGRANYIKIPVFASFNFGEADQRVRPRLTIGPSVQFLVGGKSFIRTDADAFAGRYTTRAMNTKIDVGGNASLGFNIRIFDGFYLNHEINYYHGFVEQKPNTPSETPSFTNRNLTMSLGMQINGEAMRKWKGKMMKMHHK